MTEPSDTPETDGIIKAIAASGGDTERALHIITGLACKIERERDAARAELLSLEPIHRHTWTDACRVVDCGANQAWRLERCDCGSMREKAGTREATDPTNPD